MSNNEACIVIPVYKETLSYNESNALKRCFEIYEQKFDIFLIHPSNLIISAYRIGKYKGTIPFANKFFKSNLTYNRLMLSPGFYRKFLEYKYMLIYQLDAFILRDMLSETCRWNMDFIGAPWLDQKWKMEMNRKWKTTFFTRFFLDVGNGGFSLRNIKKAYRISKAFQPLMIFWKENWNEDLFWSTVCNKLIPGYKVADINTALKFAFESEPQKAFKLNNNELPFGCHAWEQNDPEFWMNIFKNLGYSMK